MRIAIPIALQDNAPLLAEDFSRASLFAFFDIHDDTRAVAYAGRQSLDNPGCARTAPFLREHKVEVVLGHRVSENAQNHLLEQGILTIKDAAVMSPDALVAHLVSGTLQATPPEAAIHGEGCGGGGCAHCTNHHDHDHDHADPAPSAGCASHCPPTP